MAGTKYRGTGKIAETDYKSVKWVGQTKNGTAVTITMESAINLGNIDWTFAEKDSLVAEVVYTAVYNNTSKTADETVEPWTIEVGGTITDVADGIQLGAGIFYIGETPIALTRGGGKFSVEREYNNIAADGDRGPVKGRITLDASTATLTMNALQVLSRITDLYSAVETVSE